VAPRPARTGKGHTSRGLAGFGQTVWAQNTPRSAQNQPAQSGRLAHFAPDSGRSRPSALSGQNRPGQGALTCSVSRRYEGKGPQGCALHPCRGAMGPAGAELAQPLSFQSWRLSRFRTRRRGTAGILHRILGGNADGSGQAVDCVRCWSVARRPQSRWQCRCQLASRYRDSGCESLCVLGGEWVGGWVGGWVFGCMCLFFRHGHAHTTHTLTRKHRFSGPGQKRGRTQSRSAARETLAKACVMMRVGMSMAGRGGRGESGGESE